MGLSKSSQSSIGSLYGKVPSTNFQLQQEETEIFYESGTWYKPPWAQLVEVLLVGAGGGGGSGRKTAVGSNREGGGGGGSGSGQIFYFPGSTLNSQETVTIGLGGTGGISQIANTTIGYTGLNGGNTTFFNRIGYGGRGGPGGTNSFSGLGSPGIPFPGATVSATLNTASLNVEATSLFLLTTPSLAVFRGIGGGGITSTNVILSPTNSTSTSIARYPNFWPRNAIFADELYSPNLTIGLPGEASDTTNATDGTSATLFGSGGGGGGGATNNVGNSGAGGNGGNGIAVIKSYAYADYQLFTSSGTWYKPIGPYSKVIVFAIGGGGGGSAGAVGNTLTVRFGGTGGNAGSMVINSFSYKDMNSTETVTVGLGGIGGDVNSTAGNPGQDSLFGSTITAKGGLAFSIGSLPSQTQVPLGIPNTGFNGRVGIRGGQGSSIPGTLALISSTGSLLLGAGGGAGGGGLTTSTTGAPTNGGLGVASPWSPATLVGADLGHAAGGSSGSLNGENGDTVGYTDEYLKLGPGGGGGRSNQTGNAGNGGNGAFPGGGGGGGGATSTGFTPGSGGNGGNGAVWVICI